MEVSKLIHETSQEKNDKAMVANRDFKPSCPFCMIAATFGPIDPLIAPGSPALHPEKLYPPSFVLFSTPHVIAFLDILPITRGHVLVSPRKHRVKVGDLSPDESAEIGRVLPMLARAIMKAVLPDIPHDQVDYNIVQNNGPGAAQVVRHVHYHVIPRPPLNYQVPKPGSASRPYPPNKVPEGHRRQMILLGRGQRDELFEDEAQVLVEEMRQCIKEEWEASNPTASSPMPPGNPQPASYKENAGSRNGQWKV